MTVPIPRKQRLAVSLIAGSMAFAIASLASASPASTAALSDGELARIRGGFVTAGGLTFGFGAVESTYINGQLALLTTINLTDNGLLAAETRGAATGGQVLDAALASALGVPAGAGVGVSGPGGKAIVLNSINANQIVNLLINSASNQTIRQNTAVTLTLPGFDQLRQSAATAQTSAGLAQALNAASLTTLSH